MPDKLTDKEIVKALELCGDENASCEKCPFLKDDFCRFPLAHNALDLINRLQAKNEELVGNTDKLKAENERLEKEITAWINENNIKASNLEWAKKEIKKLGGIKTTDWLIKGIPQKQLAQERIEALVDNAKTEAYKEFAERLKDGTGYYDEMIKDVVYTEEEVDNLLKELVGEDNAKEKE